jgi:hypothetical protein
VAGWLAGWVAGWVCRCVGGWPAGRLAGWLTRWLVTTRPSEDEEIRRDAAGGSVSAVATNAAVVTTSTAGTKGEAAGDRAGGGI